MHRPLILIVDDESKIRRLLAQNLELEGFDVQTASDGAQALEVYNKSVEKPDLILLDLMMPEIDGMSMLKRLRKSSDVPVIIPEFDSYFWAKARPALSLSPKIFTVNVA